MSGNVNAGGMKMASTTRCLTGLVTDEKSWLEAMILGASFEVVPGSIASKAGGAAVPVSGPSRFVVTVTKGFVWCCHHLSILAAEVSGAPL
jgi:hypothetical protein